MLRSTICSILTIVFFSSWTPSVIALRNLEDVYEVRRGPVPGSCDAHLDLLKRMFEEIQRVNENAIEQLKTDNYNKNVETRKLAKSLFGISPSDDDEEPEARMDLQRLAKVRRWYGDLNTDINDDSVTLVNKVQLYCDSDFMIHVQLDDPNPSMPGKKVKDSVSKASAKNSWIYHVPTQYQDKGGAWLLLPLSRYPEIFPPGASGKPSYCAQAETYGWTIEPDGSERSQPMIILCPAAFTKKNIAGGDVPDQIDLAEQENGKVLDEMEPRMLTWYHELFHVTQPPDGRGTEMSPDVKYHSAKKDDEGEPLPSWPKEKAAFGKQNKQTYGAIECMYTALFDLADKPAKSLNGMLAPKNPESYAWFGVASYLSAFRAGHQDWSSGACRDKGSPD